MKIHNLIYKITNTVNNKIYIGCHQTEDVNDDYMGSGKHLNHSIQKYGIDKFKKEILYDFKTPEEMFAMEKEIVNKEFISRKDTYNIKLGGNGGWDHMKGMISVKDKDGNIFHVSNTDPRYLSGELLFTAKNTVKIKDKDGNCFHVSTTDPRYLSGELVFIAKNKVTVKDKNGNTFQIDKDDPRYLSGELVCIWTNRKHKSETCNKIKQTMSEHKHQQGQKNSQFGKCWIHNVERKENIKVKKEDIEQYLKDGWVKGRKMKF